MLNVNTWFSQSQYHVQYSSRSRSPSRSSRVSVFIVYVYTNEIRFILFFEMSDVDECYSVGWWWWYILIGKFISTRYTPFKHVRNTNLVVEMSGSFAFPEFPNDESSSRQVMNFEKHFHLNISFDQEEIKIILFKLREWRNNHGYGQKGKSGGRETTRTTRGVNCILLNLINGRTYDIESQAKAYELSFSSITYSQLTRHE